MILAIGIKDFLLGVSLVAAVALPLSGCVTMGTVANKREDLGTVKSKWIQICVVQAKQVTLKYGVLKSVDTSAKADTGSAKNSRKSDILEKVYSYVNSLEARGEVALASLNEHNCKPNVIWYSFSYPDCMEQAEKKIKKLSESGCYLEEFMADIKEYKIKVDQEEERSNAKKAEEKKYLDRQNAFILDLEKSNATHVLVRLLSGQDGRTCREQVDGSFVCESGSVCEKSGYIKAMKDQLAGIKPPRFDSYCDRDGASSQNFFFVAKEKTKFSQHEYYGNVVIPVKRGPNAVMTNGFGARRPAATWTQVAPLFDPTNTFSLAH